MYIEICKREAKKGILLERDNNPINKKATVLDYEDKVCIRYKFND